jgi:hypothetical protein
MNDWRDQEIPESLGRTRAVGLPQHPDEHRPKRPILLAVDQEFREHAGRPWARRVRRVPGADPSHHADARALGW